MLSKKMLNEWDYIMPTILSQLRKLQKQINIPYAIQFVDREVLETEFQNKIIYVHIWIW